MKRSTTAAIAIAGVLAGCVNGLFGAGGGMVLVPLLSRTHALKEENLFPASVSIILPICLISLSMSFQPGILEWRTTAMYLLGSGLGGIAAGLLGQKIPVLWLHRFLGLLILWGGVRYLC